MSEMNTDTIDILLYFGNPNSKEESEIDALANEMIQRFGLEYEPILLARAFYTAMRKVGVPHPSLDIEALMIVSVNQWNTTKDGHTLQFVLDKFSNGVA